MNNSDNIPNSGIRNKRILAYYEAVISYQDCAIKSDRKIQARLAKTALPVAALLLDKYKRAYRYIPNSDVIRDELWEKLIFIIPEQYDRTQYFVPFLMTFARYTVYSHITKNQSMANLHSALTSLDCGIQKKTSRDGSYAGEKITFNPYNIYAGETVLEAPSVLEKLDMESARDALRSKFESIPENVDLITGQAKSDKTKRSIKIFAVDKSSATIDADLDELNKISSSTGITRVDLARALEIPHERLRSYYKKRVRSIPPEIMERARKLSHSSKKNGKPSINFTPTLVLCKKWMDLLGYTEFEIDNDRKQQISFSKQIGISVKTLRRWTSGISETSNAKKAKIDKIVNDIVFLRQYHS